MVYIPPQANVKKYPGRIGVLMLLRELHDSKQVLSCQSQVDELLPGQQV
jgi:hypothetical protein